MSEIEKMYSNTGIEQTQDITCGDCEFVNYPEENKPCNACTQYGIKDYPDFTAEKQIELIKWLGDTDYHIHNIYKTIDTREYFIDNYYYDMQTNSFEETLAGLINKHWQDLTEEEKAEIKEILE